MALTRLDVSNFRNLISVKLELVPRGINLFYGQNGSGKTSLLEAIYYLSTGRSFRSTKIDRIINNSSEKLSVFAHVLTANNQKIPLGIERELDGSIKIRIAGKDINSVSELAALTPILLINSYCFQLLDGGPVFRRKYLDWGLFYFSNDFIRVWKLFERALKQRNAALRNHLPEKELEIWSKELVENAILMDQFRQEYVQQLLPLLTKIVNELLVLPNLELGYQCGWNESIPYHQALANSIDKDRHLGYTQIGPQRADLQITINGVPAKDILSRGQQKLFVCAMILAQGALLNCCSNQRPIYLIDDLPSELDAFSRSKIMAVLTEQEAQVFISAVERDVLQDFLIQPMKLFHVEHGEINERDIFNKRVENVE